MSIKEFQRIENIFGSIVLKRVKEQLASNDHQNSVCSGLVMYLLGLQESNVAVSIDKFFAG